MRQELKQAVADKTALQAKLTTEIPTILKYRLLTLRLQKAVVHISHPALVYPNGASLINRSLIFGGAAVRRVHRMYSHVTAHMRTTVGAMTRRW